MSTLTKRFGLAVLLAAVSASCTVKGTDPPPLMGPSEYALRVALSLNPDSILQDGFSQTALNIEVTGGDGRAVRGLTLRIDMVENGVFYDFGTLSAKTVVTGDDGRARAIYTSPPRQPDGTGTVVTFLVTPVGTDYRGQESRLIDLRLVQPGVIQPPNAAPIARFTFTPTPIVAFSTIIFDASSSTDVDPATRAEFPCGPSCTYTWDFGDGTTGTGVFVTHEFRRTGTLAVRLTVTDSRGASGETFQPITVGVSPAPTAEFTFSPTTPAVGQLIFFNAAQSKPALGRQIVSYLWDFGTGRTGSGVTVSKGYETAGTYTVTLTVTDDAGSTAVQTKDVTVGGGDPAAALTVSPSGGLPATNFTFSASGSTPGSAGSPIVEYRFNFGDASPEVVGTSPTTTHRYSVAGTYMASVTIRDSANRFSTATVSVNVQ
jgi:PKD repeat protein